MARCVVDLTGMRFGKLIVQSKSEIRGKHGKVLWLCNCECGNTRLAIAGNLTVGTALSCGCESYATRKTHGMTKTPTFKSWDSMKQRCLNKNAPDYPRYGLRGIRICERWLESFSNFLEDMGERPYGKTLDRIDNNGNYEPDNCKWSTRSEQQRNKSTSTFITMDGLIKTPAEWSEIVGISSKIICDRIKRGWPPNEALTKPNRKRKK